MRIIQIMNAQIDRYYVIDATFLLNANIFFSISKIYVVKIKSSAKSVP
jgi:hypothetical protein